MAGHHNYITPRGAKRIQKELKWLQSVERPRIVEEVAYAASLGDRSENAEYHYGKKKLRQIDSRIRFLLKRLESCRVVDPAEVKGDKVRFGATVLIADDEGNEKTWRLWGEDEVDVDRKILSWRSPLARALMGKGEGEDATFKAPAGKRYYEILEVSFLEQEPLTDEEWQVPRYARA